MSLGRYLIGVAALLCVLGSLVSARPLYGGISSRTGAAPMPAWPRSSPGRAAGRIMEVLGTVGLFRLVPMVVGSIAVGSALKLGLTSRSGARVARRRAARPGDSAAVLILMSVAGLVVVLLLWTRRSLQSSSTGSPP